jgi:hypothetical protein
MSLEAQPPARVIETIGDGGRRIRGAFVAVHRLQPEMREGEAAQFSWPEALLRENELQLGPRVGNERRACLRADAKPIETGRRGEGAIGFDGDFEAPGVDRADQRLIELQQGLAAGENNKPVRFASGPNALDCHRKGFRAGKTSAAPPVHSHEIGIAETANGGGTIFLLAGPEIAAGKAAKYGGAPGVRAFALQSEEDFLYRIFAHARLSPRNIDKLKHILPKES